MSMDTGRATETLTAAAGSTASLSCDLLIIGAGMGGSALAYALRDSGLDILILERGVRFRQEHANWDPQQVIAARRYEPEEKWLDEKDRPFTPRVYYTTGGSSKFFGASSFRLRSGDFGTRSYPEGDTVAWPIDYDDLAPFYDAAERRMGVHGLRGSDPSDPPRGSEFPFPPLEHEPAIAWLEGRLRSAGLSPFPLPMAVDQGPGGRCRKGSPCDGFPCKVRAKGDGENAFLRPALKSDSVRLLTEARVLRLIAGPGGRRVARAEAFHAGKTVSITAHTFVLAAGAVNSAALLLASRNKKHPAGLGNSSDQAGRNFMSHNNTVLLAFSPSRKNPTAFQKTLALNDFYPGPRVAADAAVGNVQMRGKLLPLNLAAGYGAAARLFPRSIARRSFDFWIMSEDLPDPENRVELTADGRIRLSRHLNNIGPHRNLVAELKRVLRRAGLPVMINRPPSPGAIQHQVGTLRFGSDPNTSVFDDACRSHELDNLYAADGSLFPSAASVNPALTIAANALRIGEILRRRMC